MNKHSVSVAGVVLNSKGEILLIKRHDNGEYQIPGGVLELNETIVQGTKREIFEETNVNVIVENLTGIYKNILKGVVALVFKCQYLSGEEKVTEEATEVFWLEPEQAMKIVKYTYIQRIKDALLYDGITALRTHDGINFLDDIFNGKET